MKRPQLVSLGSLNRMLQAANEAWERRDFQQSFELLERASRFDPANPRILLKLGQSYGLRYDYVAAERCFEKAVRVSPRKTEIMVIAGSLSVDFANHRLAEGYFQRALKQKDVMPETFARLAGFYERLHRTEDASKLVDHALQLNANCALAQLTRARLNRQAGLMIEAEQVLRPILATAGRELRIRGYYELGAILDRQGRYDEAMAAFIEAKRLLAPDAPPLRAQWQVVRTYWKELQFNISAETLKRWFDLGTAFQPARRLTFLGGYPRSGTTLLEQILDSHPDIISAEETTIFHDDAYVPLTRNLPQRTSMLSVLESAQSNLIQQSRENYFRTMELHLGNSIRNHLLIDKNPSINFLIPAFVRVFPEIKLLIALRDPRDVCLSCFMQAHLPLSRGSVLYLSLENTIEAYTGVMELWRTLAPLIRNPFIEVRYEDVVEDLESVARRTLNFLGIPWDARVLGFDKYARQKMVRSPTYADVAKPVFKTALGRWRNYQKYLEPYLERLAPFLKAFGYE
jgi:tetratricopeptide (TPR) repeat protein